MNPAVAERQVTFHWEQRKQDNRPPGFASRNLSPLSEHLLCHSETVFLLSYSIPRSGMEDLGRAGVSVYRVTHDLVWQECILPVFSSPQISHIGKKIFERIYKPKMFKLKDSYGTWWWNLFLKMHASLEAMYNSHCKKIFVYMYKCDQQNYNFIQTRL